MTTVTQPPGYVNAGLTTAEMTTISETLNQPIDSLPPITELSADQLAAIETADPQIHAKISSHLREIANPTLDDPTLQLDTSSMALLLAELNKEIGELGLKFAQEGIKITKDKKHSINKKTQKNIQESIDKLAKAVKKERKGKIWGWIGAALGVVAAVAACVLTAGAAAPLVACAVVGLLCAVTSLTVQILEATGAIEKMMLATCKARGLNEEETEKYMRNVRLAITITVAVVGLLAALGSVVGSAVVAYKAAKLASDSVKVANTLSNTQRVAGVVATVAELGEAGTAIGTGVNTIGASNARSDVLESQAETKEFQAWLAKLQAVLDEETDELQKIMEKLQKLAFAEPGKVLQSLKDTFNVILSGQNENSMA